jgi:hypothetical protein
MKSWKHFVSIAIALGALVADDALGAPPVANVAAHMPAARLADLRVEINRARASDPGSFAAVKKIVARAPEAALRARGRTAPTAREIASLGKSALLPALELLALEPTHGVTADYAPTLRRDLVEAVGFLKDARALPVVQTVLDDEAEDVDTTRTAAEALARIGTEEAATKLLSSLDAAKGDRARAIVLGMGECRRLHVTEAIAERLRGTNDEAMARAAARALGRAGNAWAWRTLTDRLEEGEIRETAARALVDAFVRYDGEARDAASNALMVVDAPITPTLIASARAGASTETVKALDGLAARFARNPTRAR